MLMNWMLRIGCLAIFPLLAARVAFGGAVVPQTENAVDPAVEAVAGGANAFALDLYGQLRTREGNLFFSPYSIDRALAMVQAGARGATANEISRTLRIPDLKPAELDAATAELSRRCSSGAGDKGFELHVANAMWGEAGMTFSPEYLDHLKTDFDAELNSIDFHNAPAAAGRINQWVTSKTENRIENLISAGAISDQTKLILTNAIYFKGNWINSFNEKFTHDALWNDGKAPSADASTTKGSSNVSMMFQNGAFDYLKDNGFSALQMPYQGGDPSGHLAMLILLPDDPAGLSDLEKTLDAGRLKEIAGKLNPQPKVEVSLPKFKLETTYEMSQTLAKMGMPTLFSNAADLSGIDGKRDLFVSGVVHKAFVRVDETGTEAAAATGVMVTAMAMRQRVVFTADHPFIFVIRDVKAGTILFMGRVVNPGA